MSTCRDLAARRGQLSLGGIGKTFSERACPPLPFLMSQPNLCGRREAFSTATYFPFLFAATTLAEEMKGMQVKWPLLWNFFGTSSLAFFYRIFIFLCTKVYPWHCFQTWNSLQFSQEPFELLEQSFPSRTLILFWLHFDCLRASWALLETLPLAGLSCSHHQLQGQRTGTDKDWEVKWVVSPCPTWLRMEVDDMVLQDGSGGFPQCTKQNQVCSLKSFPGGKSCGKSGQRHC